MPKDRRDPDLWLAPTSVCIEPVSRAMKKPCSCCRERVVNRRLKVVVGSSRSATTLVFCVTCGSELLRQLKSESDLCRKRLEGIDIMVRISKQERVLDIAIQNEKLAAKERKAKKEAVLK